MGPVPLHPNLQELITAAGIDLCSTRTAFFSPFIFPTPKIQVCTALLPAVKFKLLNPGSSVTIFGFQGYKYVRYHDDFNLIRLEGSSYIQLPCAKEALLTAINKHEKTGFEITLDKWEYFSETACTYLIRQQLSKLKHSGYLDIGNKALYPLRLAYGIAQQKSIHGNEYRYVLDNCWSVYEQYLNQPDVKELFQWSALCKNSKDAFLTATNLFFNKLIELSNLKTSINAKYIVNLIDEITELFFQIQNIENWVSYDDMAFYS